MKNFKLTILASLVLAGCGSSDRDVPVQNNTNTPSPATSTTTPKTTPKQTTNQTNTAKNKTLLTDDFQSGNLDKWQTFNLGGKNDWHTEAYKKEQFAVANCYQSDAACDDWLVSPEIDLAELTTPTLTFSNAWKFGKNATEQMMVKIATDFTDDVSKATWQDLSDKATWSTGDFKFVDSDIDLSEFAGKKVRIAFHYKSAVADATKWEIDNVSVANAVYSLKTNTAKDKVYAGRAHQFTANAKGGKEAYTYEWDFGDGSAIKTGENVSHTFAKAGDYNVTVMVKDATGQTLTETISRKVTAQTAFSVPAKKGDVRVATFNVGLDRFKKATEMATALADGNDKQAKKIAEIIQRANPDILLINEIDGNDDKQTLNIFNEKYLKVAQNGAEAVTYDAMYMSDCNTGVPSGKDYNNNDKTTDPDDAYGFGNYAGQYCMAILSKYPIDTDNVRTFQKFKWKDMPNALRPTNEDGSQWYTDEEWSDFRLSSKTHIDLPVTVDGKAIHILASHPTPPVFDGKEDRNGKRNFDEIRLWADYINPETDYIYDDNGNTGVTLATDTRFVILGDENASAVEGDATKSNGVTAINQLLLSPLVHKHLREDQEIVKIPMSKGGSENDTKGSYGKYHTASWKMRADYVLPSAFGFDITQSGVFWPTKADDLYYLVNKTDDKDMPSSDHRMVWVDLSIK